MTDILEASRTPEAELAFTTKPETYQVPTTVAEDVATAQQHIVGSEEWRKLESIAQPQEDNFARLTAAQFELMESARKGEDNVTAGAELVDSALRLTVGMGLPEKWRNTVGGITNAITKRFWGNLKNIEHPFFYREERAIAETWFGKSFQGVSMEQVYDLVAQVDYSGIHKRNTRSLPEGFRPDWSNVQKLPNGIAFPLQEIDNKLLRTDVKWEANDWRKRVTEAEKIAVYLATNAEKFGGAEAKIIIVDIGGGNGEGSHLIALAKELPENAIVVVRELNPNMAAEGERKIQAMGLKGKVVFMVGDAQQPLDQDKLEELAPGYKDAPVAAVVSSYNVGAMPKEVAQNALTQAYRDAAPGALITVYDFAEPSVNNETRNDFLSQTGKAGEVFESTRPWMGPGLARCYENWRHDPTNIQRVSETLNGLAGSGTFKDEWEVTVFTMVPLLSGDKTTKCLIAPGFVQRTVRGIKP